VANLAWLLLRTHAAAEMTNGRPRIKAPREARRQSARDQMAWRRPLPMPMQHGLYTPIRHVALPPLPAAMTSPLHEEIAQL